MFTTVKELSFKVSKAHMLAPYGVLAFEMGGDESGQADGGHTFGGQGHLSGAGRRSELAARRRRATLAVPVKLGLSLSDYYEGIDENGDLTTRSASSTSAAWSPCR